MPQRDHAAREALGRSLSALVIGTPEAKEERDRSLYHLRAQDMAQHIRVPINGKVGRLMLWAEVGLHFPVPFIMGLDRRGTEGSLDDPHVTYGIYMNTPGASVVIQPQVTAWTTDDRGFYSGAQLRVGAFSPGAPKGVSFQAGLHLTFSGYGAPSEDDSQG